MKLLTSSWSSSKWNNLHKSAYKKNPSKIASKSNLIFILSQLLFWIEEKIKLNCLNVCVYKVMWKKTLNNDFSRFIFLCASATTIHIPMHIERRKVYEVKQGKRKDWTHFQLHVSIMHMKRFHRRFCNFLASSSCFSFFVF